MNKIEERKRMVLAMEYIARQVNDEDTFMLWLMVGVADGDIDYGCMDIDSVDDYYVEDERFRDLMTMFLRRMVDAWDDGGLYCGGVVSRDKKK